MQIRKIKTTFHRLLLLMLLSGSLLQISGCSSVTVRPNGGTKDYNPPTYSQKISYYFWSIQGEHTIDTTKACEGRQVTQMQSVTSVSDWIISALTLGVYVRKTANVWCEI